MNSKKTIVFIPGGPGLSARTFDLFLTPHLKEHFNLRFYHPMGTGGNPPSKVSSYKTLLDGLTEFVKNIETDVILFGHSFGGILATDLACSKKFLKIKGLAVLGTPFSKDAFNTINATYEEKMDDQAREAVNLFSRSPSNENYKELLVGCKNIYFDNPSEKALNAIREDSCSVNIFINVREEGEKKEYLLEQAKNISYPTVFMAGERDALFTLESCEREANKGNFKLVTIPQAGHFAYIDNPEGVADALKTIFLKKEIV